MKWTWYLVEGYPNYMVSDYGEVINTNTMRILRKDNRKGYFSVRLSKDNESKAFSVHRLVATAFLGNPYKLPQVNHKDGDRENNYVGNLEWCTQEFNLRHQQENGLCPKGQANGNSKLTESEVISIIKLNNGKLTRKEVAKKFNCSADNIGQIWKNKTWKHIPR